MIPFPTTFPILILFPSKYERRLFFNSGHLLRPFFCESLFIDSSSISRDVSSPVLIVISRVVLAVAEATSPLSVHVIPSDDCCIQFCFAGSGINCGSTSSTSVPVTHEADICLSSSFAITLVTSGTDTCLSSCPSSSDFTFEVDTFPSSWFVTSHVTFEIGKCLSSCFLSSLMKQKKEQSLERFNCSAHLMFTVRSYFPLVFLKWVPFQANIITFIGNYADYQGRVLDTRLSLKNLNAYGCHGNCQQRDTKQPMLSNELVTKGNIYGIVGCWISTFVLFLPREQAFACMYALLPRVSTKKNKTRLPWEES